MPSMCPCLDFTNSEETKSSGRPEPGARIKLGSLMANVKDAASLESSKSTPPANSALCPMTLYKLFENKVVLNASGSRYFLRGSWYFAQNRMLEVMDGSGEAQKVFF